MDRKQIEKEANEAIHKHYNCNGKYPCKENDDCMYCNGQNTAYDCNECRADEFNEGFIKGVNWRINSVWHDTNEKPENDRAYLAEYMDGAFIVFYSNIEFDVMAKAYKIRRWAYIDDLLPKRKEDAE